MNLERVCYGCFAEKEPGMPCMNCGFNENDDQPYLALPLGTILNGRYLTGKVLGIGGFGITYLGYDLTLEIKVAIKEYMPSSLATRHSDHYSVVMTGRVEQDYQSGMERFLDEAKILAKLQNTQHIVSVQNYFKENSTAYFVMEYIDGMSLKDYLSKNGDRIPYNQAIVILQPIMEALVQVHSLNLLHRDISPDNIYITSSGESRLLDFGAARFALGDGKSVSVILKHGYAPEEQYSSHGNQGPWTDVYAMGATMYRCITGQLPPDSVSRIHGDTLKPPSELGINIPANVEGAIMKALSVKTEDRFQSMDEFIAALSGRVPMQNQITAAINKRTQSSGFAQDSYGQTVYQPSQPSGYQPTDNTGTATNKTSGFSKFISYMKKNPIIAAAAGGGVLVLLALCIILPIVLSNRGGKTPTGGGGGGGGGNITGSGSMPITSQMPTNPTPQPVQLAEHDLGILNATIGIPADYANEGVGKFMNEEKGCIVMVDYIWSIEGPIYTLADFESQREVFVGNLMETLEVDDYNILAAGPDTVGDRNAYQVYFEGTDADGVTMEMVVMAVEGYDFGCYCIVTAYYKGDTAAQSEIHTIIQSFESDGKPETSYRAYIARNAKVQVIMDDKLIGGGMRDNGVEVSGLGRVEELFLFPTPQDYAQGPGFGSGVEIGKAAEFNLSSPQEVVQFLKNISGTNNNTYTLTSGGVEWLAYDYSVGDKHISYASAMIDGECFLVGCLYKDADKDTVVKIYNQAIATVRAYNG